MTESEHLEIVIGAITATITLDPNETIVMLDRSMTWADLAGIAQAAIGLAAGLVDEAAAYHCVSPLAYCQQLAMSNHMREAG